MMIYPLTIAASATGVSQQLRDWAIQTLQMIGDRLGIGQALEAIPADSACPRESSAGGHFF
jgi:hypothetical protein